MDKLLAKIQKYLGRLSRRETLAVAAGAIAAVVLLWHFVIYQPYSENVQLLETEIKQVEAKIIVANAKNSQLQAGMNKDPDLENRNLLAEYSEEATRLDEELAETSVQIIDVRGMVSLLKAMLEKQSNLKFVSLENKPAVAEIIETGQPAGDVVSNQGAISIYRHSVVLKMEGSYSSLLFYLQALEKLPWKFFWQGIEIQTESYPNAQIKLELYTLGFREGLIGV